MYILIPSLLLLLSIVYTENLSLSSILIKILLITKRSQLIYFILGLMLGSIYAVFMGPTTLEIPKPAMTFNTFSIIFFLIGGAIILLLQKTKTAFKKNSMKKTKIKCETSKVN